MIDLSRAWTVFSLVVRRVSATRCLQHGNRAANDSGRQEIRGFLRPVADLIHFERRNGAMSFSGGAWY